MANNKELLAILAKNASQSDSFNTSNQAHRHQALRLSASSRNPSGSPIRKRHWCLSLAIIIGCGWITHTTTATIALNEDQTKALLPAAAVDSKQNGDMESDPIDGQALSNAPLLSAASQGSDDSQNASEEVTELPEKPAPSLTIKSYKIGKGESLGVIFRKMELDLSIPHFISKHETAKQLTSIRAGKTLNFGFDASGKLKELHYPVNALQKLVVSLDGNQVTDAVINDLEYRTEQRTVSGEITSSLYLAAQKAGLSNNLIMEMVRIFGWDIDFVQDIRAGDHFHIVYNEHVRDATKLADGPILAAEFTTQGRTYQAIRFADNDNEPANYFNAQGESMLGTFLRSPVEFSRISSRFGKRLHPISKKWKAHKGVDYAAPTGTPIRATADGRVILAGRKGGYGKTVVLRHAGRFSTLYAHMNGFAKGIRNGARVKQGQTIGYVGTTGMSTGPHLHYEFRVDGAHRNPLTYKTPKASSVSSENMAKFNQQSASLLAQLSAIKDRFELAKSDKGIKPKKL